MTLTSSPRSRTIQEQKADLKPTPESVQRAFEANLRERNALTAEFGIVFDPFRDGELLHTRTA